MHCYLESYSGGLIVIQYTRYKSTAAERRMWSPMRCELHQFYCLHCGNCHSLANKTVIQLQLKSTTGSSYLLEYIRYFCRGMIKHQKKIKLKKIRFAFLCELIIVCIRMLSLILLLKWFRWCRYQYYRCYHSVARQCVHCCKGDAASQWEVAILGVSELRNPWTDRLQIWHTWLCRWVELVCQIS